MKGFYNLDEVLSVSILDICNYLGVPVEGSGRSKFCKMRNEKTASCKLYLDNQDGHDTFCDFGDGNRGGNVINFVMTRERCDRQKAIDWIAETFGLQPQNNTDYENVNELSDRAWQKLGVYGDLATKNMEFDLEHNPLEKVQKDSEKYAMPVNQLRKDYPTKYAQEILKKKAIPFVYNLRNQYYLTLYTWLSLQKSLVGHFDINNVPEDDRKEAMALCDQLTQAEKLLKKALNGTDIRYSFKKYNLYQDLTQLHLGQISFEIGENSYTEVKSESKLQGVDLRYRSVSCDDYFSLNEYGLNSVFHAAFVKNDKVNLVFLPEQSELIDKCISLYQTAKDLEQQERQKALSDDRKSTTPVNIPEER